MECSIFAVDDPLLLLGHPGGSFLHGESFWSRHDPAAVLVAAHRLAFAGSVVDVGTRDGALSLLAQLIRPEDPVIAVARDADSAELISANAAINDLHVVLHEPGSSATVTDGVSLVITRPAVDSPEVPRLIGRDRPAVLRLADPHGSQRPQQAGYVAITADEPADTAALASAATVLMVPAEQADTVRAGVAAARVARATAAPGWVNSGTRAAARLVDRDRELMARAYEARAAELELAARRARDQMQDARDQLAALRGVPGHGILGSLRNPT